VEASTGDGLGASHLHPWLDSTPPTSGYTMFASALGGP
jgi:hypothetical protein